MKNILIIGATSAIAEATARSFAQRGDKLYLVARNTTRLAAIAEDLRIRGAKAVDHNQLDVDQFANHSACIDQAFNTLEHIDIVLIAHGTLPDQKACEQDWNIALQAINTNAISTILLLTHIANKLTAQKSGTIAVITSVAGDRGRQSNYIYGASKRMVSTFLQGLRNRLHQSNVNVIDIKLGLVDTPMTKYFDKGILWSSPNDIATGIAASINKNRQTVYIPKFWRLIMFIIRSIPENIFKRMKL